LAILQCEREKK